MNLKTILFIIFAVASYCLTFIFLNTQSDLAILAFAITNTVILLLTILFIKNKNKTQ